MKPFVCGCGRSVYFDNHVCSSCGRQLAFDPEMLVMRAEQEPGAGLPSCANRDGPSRCNWIAAPEDDATCLSCRTSRIIPALSKPENRERWRKLEVAKRRLLYDLLRIGLPVDADHLKFVFKEDRRTNPDVHEDHVSIGHADGVITINAAEADEVYRELMRQQLNEPYRTLLGHFRHESGHYFFDVVVDAAHRPQAQSLFGDPSADYREALSAYYRDGPPDGWHESYISSYASAHPAEDWAECWAHYLHIRAVLETATTMGLWTQSATVDWQTTFIDLVLAVNELMRSLGLPDAYPFVITTSVAAKITFVHESIERFTGRRGVL